MAERGSDVFCYGTLLFPEVMRVVSGIAGAGRPAVAHGWARYRVRGEAFPALIESAGVLTRGAVFERVDALALAKLDAFEGPLYVRRALEVEFDGGARASAQAWVIAPGREAEVTREPWEPDEFAVRELREFAARVAARGTPYAGG